MINYNQCFIFKIFNIKYSLYTFIYIILKGFKGVFLVCDTEDYDNFIWHK